MRSTSIICFVNIGIEQDDINSQHMQTRVKYPFSSVSKIVKSRTNSLLLELVKSKRNNSTCDKIK